MRVLFDHSVRQDAIRAEHGFMQEQDELYGKPYTYLKLHTRVRPPRNDWRQTEIDCLPFIARLINEGKILPFTTDELRAEEFRALKYPSPHLEDIFTDVKFERLRPPLDRSKWGLSIDQYCSKEAVISYCEGFLLSPSNQRVETFIQEMRRNTRITLSEFEERCLCRLNVFKDTCKGIDRIHYPDALHLWTAEENGIDVFLTVDKKFRNVIERQKIDIQCRVLFPFGLKSELS